jgi:hypothetical protein
LATLDDKRAILGAGRILLTHMSDEVLSRIPDLEAKGYEVARDGLVVDI